MMLATEAQDAWCPPTLSLSRLGRRWLAWWMVQLDSQSSFRSIACSIASRSEPDRRAARMRDRQFRHVLPPPPAAWSVARAGC